MGRGLLVVVVLAVAVSGCASESGGTGGGQRSPGELCIESDPYYGGAPDCVPGEDPAIERQRERDEADWMAEQQAEDYAEWLGDQAQRKYDELNGYQDPGYDGFEGYGDP